MSAPNKSTTPAAKPSGSPPTIPIGQAPKPASQSAKPVAPAAQSIGPAAHRSSQPARPTAQAAQPSVQAAKPREQVSQATVTSNKPVRQTDKPAEAAADRNAAAAAASASGTTAPKHGPAGRDSEGVDPLGATLKRVCEKLEQTAARVAESASQAASAPQVKPLDQFKFECLSANHQTGVYKQLFNFLKFYDQLKQREREPLRRPFGSS